RRAPLFRPLPLHPPSQRQGARRSRASPQLRADRPSLLLRAEECVRGLPAAGGPRVLPPLECEALAAFGVHAVRLDASEPHPPALGDGGIDLYVRSLRPSP